MSGKDDMDARKEVDLRRRRLFQATTVLVLLLLLFVADRAVGLLYERLAPRRGRRAVSRLLGEIGREELSERPHPYLLWENTPGYTSGGVRQINAQGYRNTSDITPEPAPGVDRILVLGGSTAFGYLLSGPADAWPEQLERLLNERRGGGRRAEVVNGALNFGTSAEWLTHYLFRDRYLRPKIVIVLAGGNDAAPLLYADYDPEYRHFRPGWPAMARLRYGEETLVRHSHLARLFLAFWLQKSADEPVPLVNKAARELSTVGHDEAVANATKNEPVGFRRNMDLLIRNIIQDGARPVLFGFLPAPKEVYTDAAADVVLRASDVRAIHDGNLIAIEKNKRVMRDLSDRYHVPYFEIAPIPFERFLDQCHLDREGEAMKARFMAERIAPMLDGN